MKEWLLYCVLCSLIYAMAVHARPINPREMTAELLISPTQTIPVRDCALFMPYLGRETESLRQNLRTLGYNAQVSKDIHLDRVEFKDSAGHSVNEYHTRFDQGIGWYGHNTILMSVEGLESLRKRKTVFRLRINLLGSPEVRIPPAVLTAVSSERKFTVKDFPRCRPKALY